MNVPAVMNHLWQSSTFVFMAALVTWGLRHNGARVRFGVWLAASLKFVVPFGVLAGVGAVLGARLPSTPLPAAAGLATHFDVVVLPAGVASLTPASGFPWFWGLGGVWLVGSLVLAVRWVGQWRRTARLVRVAEPRDEAGLRMRVTEAMVEPGVFGMIRPVLLVPAGIRERLTPAQWEAVLAHERCHIARRDNLWAALHRAVETVFWFHPFVWWIGTRLVAERERACDEAVLRAGGNAVAYAGGILRVCRHYMDAPLVCASGVTGGPLQRRVRAILDGRWGRTLGVKGRCTLAGMGALALLGPLAVGAIYAQAKPARFAVASIRPGEPGGKRVWQVNPQRLTAENVSLKELIVAAYDLHGYQLQAPKWMSSELFSISGTTTVPLTEKAITALLQPLLVRQFDLKTHRETVTKKVEVLQLLPDGPKVQALTGPLPAGVTAGAFHVQYRPEGLEMTGVDEMSQFAGFLSVVLDQTVMNKTGLAGVYKFDLTFATPSGKFEMGGLPRPMGLPERTFKMTAPPLTTALAEQVGVKLTKKKEPIELFVVDSAKKEPLGN